MLGGDKYYEKIKQYERVLNYNAVLERKLAHNLNKAFRLEIIQKVIFK